MTKLLTAIFLSTLISCGPSKEPIDKDKEKLDAVCDKFVQDFTGGLYNESMDLLRENSVLEREKIDTLRSTILRQSDNVFPAYGKLISFEFIRERKIKDFIAKRFYILKFEKYPIELDFTMYKSSRGWAITSFSYNDELVEVLY